MAKEPSAGPWSEVCKKVAFGDGLYRDCREHVPGFDGFQKSSFDSLSASSPEDEDFSRSIQRDAVPPPPPPTRRKHRDRHAMVPPSPEALEVAAMGDTEEEDEEGFLEGFLDRPWFLYGGIALAIYFLFFHKQEVVTTEKAPALPAPAPLVPAVNPNL